MIKCRLKLTNPECFKQWIKNENDAFDCTAIEVRYLHFSAIPRTGESILYPHLNILKEDLAWWLHRCIRLVVCDVIYNSLKVTSFGDILDCEIPHDEFEIILFVEAINKPFIL
jgi:hypothetical protein